jgi:hypothetical protein
MTPEQQARFEQLVRDMELLKSEIESEKNKRKTQQLAYPLDPASQTMVDANKFVVIGARVAGTPTSNGHFVVSLNGRQYKIMTTA